MKNGVPFDRAFKITPGSDFTLDYLEEAAMGFIFAEYEGNKFNWNTLQFVDPD